MRISRPVVACALALALTGCYRAPIPEEKQETKLQPNTNRPPAELIVGAWQLAENANDVPRLDWAFLDENLKGNEITLRIGGDGKLTATPKDADKGAEAAYAFRDETIEIRPDQKKPTRLRVTVTEDELTLNDSKQHALRFTRVPAVGGEIKISGLPLCCMGCKMALSKELERVPGLSDLDINLKSKSAVMKLNDVEQAGSLEAALRKAGMNGLIAVNGKPVGPTHNVLGKVEGNQLVLTNIHACCGGCEQNIKAAVPDAKVAIEGDGKIKTVTISADKLDAKKILAELAKAGYHVKLANAEVQPEKDKP